MVIFGYKLQGIAISGIRVSLAPGALEPLWPLQVVTRFAIFQPQQRFLYLVKETARLLPAARR
jgi:hypothetical protein